jgi:hypothetical protein
MIHRDNMQRRKGEEAKRGRALILLFPFSPFLPCDRL